MRDLDSSFAEIEKHYPGFTAEYTKACIRGEGVPFLAENFASVCREEARLDAEAAAPHMRAPGPHRGGDTVSAEDGHQFHFSVTSQGSYAVGDGPHEDSEYIGEPFRLTVRAWSLREACEKAAAVSLAEWVQPEEDDGLL